MGRKLVEGLRAPDQLIKKTGERHSRSEALGELYQYLAATS